MSETIEPTDTAVTSAPREPQPGDRATGLGSWPGTDPREVARTVVGELPGLPHVPRAPGSVPVSSPAPCAAGSPWSRSPPPRS